MKKLMTTLLLAMMISPMAVLADRKTTDLNELPKNAQAFLSQHFKGKTITIIEVDRNSFDAKLNDGSEVEFTTAGKWKEVKCYAGVPTVLIPKAINDYVVQKHPDTKIIKISLKTYGYSIDLMNDIEIKFNKEGAFLNYDN